MRTYYFLTRQSLINALEVLLSMKTQIIVRIRLTPQIWVSRSS